MEGSVQEEIKRSLHEIFDAYQREDYDYVLTKYTKEPVYLPNNYRTIQGKPAIKNMLQSIIPNLKGLRFEEIIYFEQLNEDTALTNGNVVCDDEQGEVNIAFRDFVLWRKVDGVWLIDRDMFNVRV